MSTETETIVVNDEMMDRAMRQAVEERGRDYVYPTIEEDPDAWAMPKDNGIFNPACIYTKADGTPMCIIGLALSKLGITVPHDLIMDVGELTADIWEEDAPVDENGMPMYASVLPNVEWGISFKMRKALVDAQLAQDGGKTWGKAYDMYESYLNR